MFLKLRFDSRYKIKIQDKAIRTKTKILKGISTEIYYWVFDFFLLYVLYYMQSVNMWKFGESSFTWTNIFIGDFLYKMCHISTDLYFTVMRSRKLIFLLSLHFGLKCVIFSLSKHGWLFLLYIIPNSKLKTK